MSEYGGYDRQQLAGTGYLLPKLCVSIPGMGKHNLGSCSGITGSGEFKPELDIR